MNLLRSFVSKASCFTLALARRPDGSTTVEFAFLAPILALLLGGMIEIGNLVQIAMLANNAAREGAHYIALGDCANAFSAPVTYMTNALGGRGNVSVGSVSMKVGATTITNQTCPPAVGSEVSVSFPVTVTLNMPVVQSVFGGSTIALNASSSMVRYSIT